MAKKINRMAKNWSDSDLVAWAMGEVETGADVSDESLIDEANKRMGTEHDNLDSVKEALKAASANEPAEKEVEPAPAAPEAAPEAPKEVKKETPAPKAAAKVDMGDSSALVMIQNNLNEYLEKMEPGRAHSGNEGATAQVKFYRTIQSILRQQGGDFTKAFGGLLKVVHENRKGVFNERYLFRYFDALTLTNPERRNFERVLNLLVTTSNPATRAKTVKQVDLDATMEGFKNSDMHQRVIGFYTSV